jgi:hypothetical protein
MTREHAYQHLVSAGVKSGYERVLILDAAEEHEVWREKLSNGSYVTVECVDGNWEFQDGWQPAILAVESH